MSASLYTEQWPCGACGREYQLGASWRSSRVVGAVNLVTYICADCAAEQAAT